MSWNPLDWIDVIISSPFWGMVFLFLFLVCVIVAFALANLIARWRTRRSKEKPIQRPPSPEVVAFVKNGPFDGFRVPQWARPYRHNETVELATLVLLREQAIRAGRRQAVQKEQEV